MYDLIIIGMGISGISAGIYAKRSGLNVLMFESETPGGVINKINHIENYPGIKYITGPDMAYNLFDEVNTMGIEYKIEKVTDVILEPDIIVHTEKNVYHAKNLLIATGRKPLQLGLKNEEKYLGKGISTCAICDGPLYKGQDVAVVGGGSSALSEAIYLSKIVNKVYLIHRRNEFRGEQEIVNEIKKIDNIELILNNEVKEILEEKNELKGILLKDNTKLEVKAMFVYVGYTPNTDFLKNTSLKMENNYLIVNSKYETNIPHVYATGDIIKKDIYQMINAASEGAEAVINMLNKNE